MAVDELVYAGALVQLTCWCGIRHAVPAELRREQQRQHDRAERNVLGIYCPLGHSHVPAGESETKRLKRQLETQKNYRARETARADRERAGRIAQKGATTKARKRHAAGVCPCCKRSFANVKRHIDSQHPDYDPAA